MVASFPHDKRRGIRVGLAQRNAQDKGVRFGDEAPLVGAIGDQPVDMGRSPIAPEGKGGRALFG